MNGKNIKENEAIQLPKEELNTIWDSIKNEILDVLNGKISINEDISPINILLKVEDEEHQ